MKRLLDWGLFTVFLASLWVFAGPAALGGSASYVLVDGRSMEPTYHHGDLVVARERSSYDVGDVVTYDAPVGRTYRVIHRITEVTDDGYVTRGDNRDDPDGWVVPFDAVHGSSAVVIPHGGTVAALLRQPPGLVAVLTFGLTLTFLTRREQRGRGSPEDEAPTVAVAGPRTRILTGALFTGMAVVGLSAGLLVANASALLVDGGTIQVFGFGGPPAPDPDPEPDTAEVRISWYLFNPGGRTRTDLATETLTRPIGATYDVASRAGTHEGKRYLEVDCVTSDLKDRPTADRVGSGTGLTIDGDVSHAVCLEQQTGNDKADAEVATSGGASGDERTADDDGVQEDGS